MLVALVLALASCGSSAGSKSSSEPAAATTTSASVGALPTAKFVLHASLALGAFHHYIYEPFKAGAFTHGLLKHKIALAKAALAGLFAYHELKLALADAKASPVLSRLLVPFQALGAKLTALAGRLKGGHVEAGALGSADSDAEGLVRQAKQSGLSIGERIPGASQLAGGL